MALNVYKEWLGIPEDQCPPDHYALLRLVQFEDDADKIRGNYRRLNAHVRKYATGQYGKESQDLLNEIARAMLCLTDPERKREYDESLGREFEEEEDILGRRPMKDTLIAQGVVTKDQMKEAEEFADARGLYLRDAVVQMKLVDMETATQAYAVELGVSYVDMSEILPDDSVLDRVPRNLVKRNSFLPLFIDDDTLLIVSADQPAQELEDELRLRFNMPMKYSLATPLSINQAIAKYYAPGMRDEAVDVPSESSGAKSGKDAKAEKPAKKEKPQRKANEPLTEEEKAERKMIGIAVMCFSIFVGYLLGNFVVAELLASEMGEITTYTYLTTAVVTGATCAWVLLVYWKKQ